MTFDRRIPTNVLGILLVSAGLAQGAPPDHAFTTQDTTSLTTAPPARADRAAVRHALDDLETASGAKWRTTWNDRTGLPRSLRGASPAYPGTPRQAAEAFLAGHATLFGLDDAAQSTRYVETRQMHGGARVVLHQQHHGLDVVDGRMILFVDGGGSVRIVTTSTSPSPSAP